MDQVDEVKSKVDIVEVIRGYVELKKAGRNYRGLCPFHSEKTPSFMVSPELQIFKCFGCGEAGDVISFLTKHEGMEFYEVLKTLAERAGVKLRPVSGRVSSDKEEIIELNSLAARFYHYILLEHKLGEEYLKYLQEERGIKREVIKKFRLGAAPDRPQVLYDFLAGKKGYGIELVERAGLVIRTQRGVIDRFRGRVIFPITDHRGQTIALAGRILPLRDGGKVGKYINSPETAAYHKSNSLYGLSVTKEEIKKSGEAIVVEGELDLLSSWQVGVKNVVAIKGTALTEGQGRILSRFTKRVILALDSDFAGDAAVMRGISQIQETGLTILVARMGKYKDPDEFARKNPGGYKKVLKKAVGIWDFMIDVVFERNDARSGSGKGKISRELVPILAAIEDRIVQAHYIRLVAERLGVSEEAVNEEVAAFYSGRRFGLEKEIVDEKKSEKTVREILEMRLVGILFQQDPALLLETEVRKIILTPWAKRVIDELEKFLGDKDKFDAAEFSKGLPEEMAERFGDIFLREIEAEKESTDKEIGSIIKRIELVEMNERMGELGRLIAGLEREGDKKGLTRAKREFAGLGKRRAKLEAKS
jgi:DNA primase